MREVVLDTETTGMDIMTGHRRVEIGCVELLDLVATGATWSTCLSPRRRNEAGACGVHRLSDGFLAGQPPLLARGLFPGKDCRLAALARRPGVDAGAGALHRALADARLLAGVYAALRALGPPGEDPAASHA